MQISAYGYEYAQETGLYYLQSRYYNPHLGRFLNADALTSTGQGFVGNNMFAYCGNNPTMFIDEMGTRKVLNSKSIDPALRDVTEEINDALSKQVEEAIITKNLAYIMFGDDILAQAWVYLQFYGEVNHTEPWDIKFQDPWELTIGTCFPGSGTKVLYNGLVMTPENLGNYTYGFLGYAYGIPLDHLLGGSYYAADFPTAGSALENELFEDWPCIAFGYNAAKEILGGEKQ